MNIKMPLQYNAFDLKSLLNDIIEKVRDQTEHRAVKVILSYPDDLHSQILSDEEILRHILVHLMDNAQQFTTQGYIVLSIELIVKERREATLHFSVEDTGCGIDAHRIDHLFDQSGSGLAMVKQWVAHLKGTLGVNSCRDQGSIFWFSIPIELATEATSVTHWLRHYHHVSILMIDDNAERRERLFKKIAVDTARCAGSADAEKMLQQGTFDIILIDDEITAMNSEDLATLIHNRYTPSPLLIQYAEARPLLDPANTIRHSAFHYMLKKPIRGRELLQQLVILFEQWQDKKATEALAQKTSVMVLVVDDNPLGQKIAKSMLEEFNCTVETADNATQALQRAEKKYDLIFLDIGLPDMNGIELAKEIILHTINKETPLIALTAHASEEDRERCLAAGMIDFIAKPAGFSQFKMSLQHLKTPALVSS